MQAPTDFDLIREIFREVFADPQLTVEEDDTPVDLPRWDSLNHVILIAAIESRFGIKFRLSELMTIESVGDIAKLVATKRASL